MQHQLPEPPNGGRQVAAPLCPHSLPCRLPRGRHRPACVHSPGRWRSGREGHLWGSRGGPPCWSGAGSARGPGPASGPRPAGESLTTARSRSARGPYLGTKETWRQETSRLHTAGEGADPVTGQPDSSEKQAEAMSQTESLNFKAHLPVKTAPGRESTRGFSTGLQWQASLPSGSEASAGRSTCPMANGTGLQQGPRTLRGGSQPQGPTARHHPHQDGHALTPRLLAVARSNRSLGPSSLIFPAQQAGLGPERHMWDRGRGSYKP